MKKIATFVFVLVLMLILSTSLMAQSVGDYRTRASGDWSMAQIWQRFNGTAWVNIGTPPTGSETITVLSTDSVFVNVAVSITDTLINQGIVEPKDSLTITIANGGTYQHDRDGGSIPLSIWAVGSTMLMTGVTATAPNDRDQNYHNITFNTPGLSANLNMGLNRNIIGGNIRVINTGSTNRWQLTTVPADSTAIITIMGDVIVEGGAFSVQGTSTARTTFIVHHYGNIIVTGGNFSIARGSQGSGSGSTRWYLHEGNFSMSNASTQNSNPTPGNAKLVFAKNDTQQLAFENVTFAGGRIHFEVADTTTLQITKDFVANGNIVNHGAIQLLGTLTFANGAVYEHARDGGSVPSAIWEAGSTALFTGITGTAPANRGQDYYNLTLNTPNLSSNLDMSLNGHTISGDITLLSSGSGSSRWRLVGGSSGSVTIMGNVRVENGSLETQGTSSATDVVVNHHGNVVVTGGTFAISRGTQGGETGTGTTKWYLLEGDFSISNATTRNSNPWRATFIFAKQGGMQNLTLSNVLYESGGLPIQVDSAATLNMDTTAVGGSGLFTLNKGATLATAHPGGIAGAVQTTGTVTFDEGASYIFNGTVVQITSTLMPVIVNGLAINNAAGVVLSQITTINGVLRLMAGEFDNTIPFTLGPNGSISYEGGRLKFTVAVDEQASELPTEFALFQNYPNPFNPSTTIRYDVPNRSRVTLKIYDTMGHEVAELMNGKQHEPGAYDIVWDARGLASGVYFYRISAEDFTSVRKLILMK